MLGVASGFGQGATAPRAAEEMMSYRAEYGPLLEAIAREADAIAMKYFHADEMRVERKGDGTVVTQADRAVGEMARAKVAGDGPRRAGRGGEVSGRHRPGTKTEYPPEIHELMRRTRA